MVGQVRWTEKASSNLQGIFEYIAGDSRIYAARDVRGVIRATERLETMPRCSRVVKWGEARFVKMEQP